MLRAFFATLVLIGIAAVCYAGRLNQSSTEKSTMLKAVVHVNFGDADRHGHGLNNIENVLKEAPDSLIEVVCHGEGIKLLETARTQHADAIQALMKRGVRFAACENTMAKKSLTPNDLIAGVVTVPSGAAEVIQKQAEEYGYFRP